jgi:hypothetical protein
VSAPLCSHAVKKPPYCAPRSDVPHCAAQAPVKAPMSPPGISRSNWRFLDIEADVDRLHDHRLAGDGGVAGRSSGRSLHDGA